MAAPRDICNLYAQLLDIADVVLRRPAFDPGREARLLELRERIDAAIALPAERRLIFDHASLLAQALLMAERGKEGGASPGQVDRLMAGNQIAGVLIPWVQGHLHAALVASREGPRTTEQDYLTR